MPSGSRRSRIASRWVIGLTGSAWLFAGCTSGSGGAASPTGPPVASVTSPISVVTAPPANEAMPNLLGLQREAAEWKLDALGVVFFVRAAGPPLDDRVVRQFPAPGRMLGEVKRVILRVGCLPAPCPSPVTGTIYDDCSCAVR